MAQLSIALYHNLASSNTITYGLNDGFAMIYVYGTSTGAVTTNFTGTVARDMDLFIEWTGDSGANAVTIQGAAMPASMALVKCFIHLHYNYLTTAWKVDFIPSGDTAFLVNSMVKALAGIEVTKLEAKTANRATQFGASGFIEPSTVTIVELAILAGALITTTELNYLQGATSNIQAQIDALDPLWQAGAGVGSLMDKRSTSAAGAGALAAGLTAVSSAASGQAIGVSANNAGASGQAIGAGASNAAGGGNGQAIGATASNTGTSGQAIGEQSNNSASVGQAVGNQANNSAAGGQAIGTTSINSGQNGQAIGSDSNNSGQNAQALGESAVNRIDSSTNISGAIVIRKSDAAADLLPYQFSSGAEVVIMSENFDATGAVTVDAGAFPAGVRFFPTEVGIIVTSANTVTVQPTVSYGISGNNALFIAAAITSGLTTAGARERKTSLLTFAGQTSLTAEVTIAATATTLECRCYWKGFVAENQ
jgi:hypothetical protein